MILSKKVALKASQGKRSLVIRNTRVYYSPSLEREQSHYSMLDTFSDVTRFLDFPAI